MKILFHNPVPAARRRVPLQAIKGSAFFRQPVYDAMRLKYLSAGHEFHYYDEQLQERPVYEPDLVVVHLPLNLCRYAETSLRKIWGKEPVIICYGLYPTLFPDETRAFADVVVQEDIAASWKAILSDYRKKSLRSVYRGGTGASFRVERSIENQYGMTRILTQLRTSLGCSCAADHRDYCAESILYPTRQEWPVRDVIAEIARLPKKVVDILDDDFLHDPERAREILDRSWRYKKNWLIRTGNRLFETPHILDALQEDGIRIIHMKEEWLGNDLARRIDNRAFVNQKSQEVSRVHHHRIALGARIRIGFPGETLEYFQRLARFLTDLKIDTAEFVIRTPLPRTPTYEAISARDGMVTDLTVYDLWNPVVRLDGMQLQELYTNSEWLRDRFYSWDAIVTRTVRVSQRLGLYNTILFNLVPNLSYRGNFLEKVGFPP